MFPNAIGGVMIPHNLATGSFERLIRKAGLPNFHFHRLRRTAATTLLSRDVNVKLVSEMLGHADIAITLCVYAHVSPYMQDAAVQVMENIFGNKSG